MKWRTRLRLVRHFTLVRTPFFNALDTQITILELYVLTPSCSTQIIYKYLYITDKNLQSAPNQPGRREKLQKGVWTNVIAIAFEKQYKLPCAFVFKKAYVSSSEQCRAYLQIEGKCSLKSCGNDFKGFLAKKPDEHEGCIIQVNARDTRCENHEQVTRPLNGKHRRTVKPKLVS